MTKKNILPMDPVDLYGIQPRHSELITEEVIGYLNCVNIDTSLLSEDDPLREEYVKFLNDMGNSPIVITNADIGIGESESYFDDIDFSGVNSNPSDLNMNLTRDYYISNRLWANGLFGSTLFPICPEYMGPTQFSTIKPVVAKVMGTEEEFMPMQFTFEPQELSALTTIHVSK